MLLVISPAITTQSYSALRDLAVAGAAAFFYRQGRHAALSASRKIVLIKGFLCCAFIALLLASGGRTNSYDNAEGSYNRSLHEREGDFAYWLLLLYLPAAFGAVGYRKDR